MQLFVATHNAHKIREISEILPGFEIVPDNPDGVEETAPDFAGRVAPPPPPTASCLYVPASSGAEEAAVDAEAERRERMAATRDWSWRRISA